MVFARRDQIQINAAGVIPRPLWEIALFVTLHLNVIKGVLIVVHIYVQTDALAFEKNVDGALYGGNRDPPDRNLQDLFQHPSADLAVSHDLCEKKIIAQIQGLDGFSIWFLLSV